MIKCELSSTTSIYIPESAVKSITAKSTYRSDMPYSIVIDTVNGEETLYFMTFDERSKTLERIIAQVDRYNGIAKEPSSDVGSIAKELSAIRTLLATPPEARENTEASLDLLDKPASALGLPNTVLRALASRKVKNIREFLRIRKEEMKSFRAVGNKTIKAVVRTVHEAGLRFEDPALDIMHN